jgi:uncharacterized SAM-binding protein YcdF (DUF218 family)
VPEVDLFLTKVLTRLALPLGLALWLSLLLALAALAGRRRVAAWLALSLALVVWIPSAPVGARLIAGPLEGRHAAMAPEDLPQADVIVVLGGGLDAARPPRQAAELNGAADRLVLGARLLRAGKAAYVLASGGNLPWIDAGEPEAVHAGRLLLEWGVPPDAILLEVDSRTTHENAVGTVQVMRAHRLRSALLVTSAMHMPRAYEVFRSAGLEVFPAPTDFWAVPPQRLTVLDWLPDAEAMEVSSRAIKEYLGLLAYGWRGWIRHREAG